MFTVFVNAAYVFDCCVVTSKFLMTDAPNVKIIKSSRSRKIITRENEKKNAHFAHRFYHVKSVLN